jgi:lysophospholipase L1-like esterase
MRVINVILAFVISLAVMLGVLEVGLRLLGQGPGRKINQPDSQVGWVKRPDFSFRRRTPEFDVTLETNALGLRDDPMESPAKPPGTFRVLCLGDSFVLGYAVPRKDLFVDVLERWWRAEGRQVEVINAGTEGYSTDQEAAWFAAHGADFDPDLVLLFPYENDIWWNGRTDYLGTPKPRYDSSGNLEGVPLAAPSFLSKLAVGRLLQGKPQPDFLEVGEHRVLADFAPLLREAPPGLGDAEARTGGALKALKKRCVELGAPLIVVPLPSHASIDADYGRLKFAPKALGGLADSSWDAERPVEFFLAQARTVGLPSLDPRESLRAASLGTEGEGVSLYYEDDFHLNAAGNHVLASFLKQSIDDLALFPEDFRAATVLAQAPAPAAGGADGPSDRPLWPFVFLGLWLVLGTAYVRLHPDEKGAIAFLSVGGLLAVVFTVAIGFGHVLEILPPAVARWVGIAAVLLILGFVLYKLGRRLGTILELMSSFTLRGHWYLMPLVMVLLTVGSLLVVAASSPLVAPFIYTLF